MQRPRTSFIAWTRGTSRANSISEALGGEAYTLYDLGIQSKPLVPFRYLISAARTLRYLVRRRPRSLIVQTPPVPVAAIVWAWSRLAHVPVILDTHPASFGLESARLDRIMRPFLSRLASRSEGCIVTTHQLGAIVERWGGRPLIVHEAPMPWRQRVESGRDFSPGQVLFVCTFAPDEPLRPMLDAARLLPDVRFKITGDVRRRPPDAVSAAPDNVEWTGYLESGRYVAALTAANVVLTLTDRVDSVPRSAYEGVDALRPLVITDRPHMRELFPHAVFVQNEPESIAGGISEALGRSGELIASTAAARALQEHRWERQLAELEGALGLADAGGES